MTAPPLVAPAALGAVAERDHSFRRTLGPDYAPSEREWLQLQAIDRWDDRPPSEKDLRLKIVREREGLDPEAYPPISLDRRRHVA